MEVGVNVGSGGSVPSAGLCLSFASLNVVN